ncbi:Copper amine oxidase N-terminal domain-containing protein [Natronincola peptidivorans]|uniref:Copper amine oxidase N-terminal domain-containing protein n=1 Tax=Natronincola peptidivorans TaxID=426128 RepID=A0A1I0BFY4_9FIRM|nr:stalk domain-containing protein [Natronincola peptidivorans]SET05126.1 Copper amine oxidase N-terminal domain-containing protein [Natronincola peptidivorans]
MKKKFFLFILITVLLGNITLSAAANDLFQVKGYIRNFNIIKNEELLDCHDSPIIFNNRMYLPLRSIAEVLDYKVHWHEDTETVILKQYDLLEKLAAADPFAGEYFIYGELRQIDFDNQTVEIEQHLDHHSREVYGALPLEKGAIILLQRNNHYMKIDYNDLKVGDVVGIIVTSTNEIRGMLVDS